jgi:RNA polymerase sigma factor (sigma-70 family)
MQRIDCTALLRQYAEDGSEEAFAALVKQHVDFVYSVALRQVGAPHQAEEIVQAVFIILAKKAKQLRHEKALSSWLFLTTRLTANNFVRSEMRRHHREQEAYKQSELQESSSDLWPQIAPLLDTAVRALGEEDRRAILLRFYEGKDLREVGAAMGTSDAAAKMRVTCALDKLRRFFFKNGVSSTTAVLAGAISSNSVQAAPATLSTTVTAMAMAGTTSISTSTLVKGALQTMGWTKAKTAVVAGVAAILAAGVITPIVTHYFHGSDNPSTADKAAKAILGDWARGDWESFYAKFGEPGVSRTMYDKQFPPEVKRTLAGMQIESLGEPQRGESPTMWYVLCKVRFNDGREEEGRMHVAEMPGGAKRWIYKEGGP